MYTLLACCCCTVLNLLPIEYIFVEHEIKLNTWFYICLFVHLSVHYNLILYIYRVKQLLNLTITLKLQKKTTTKGVHTGWIPMQFCLTAHVTGIVLFLCLPSFLIASNSLLPRGLIYS